MLIVGVDEAGRGPLAGPVVAAAVALPDNHGIIGLADSKKLSAKKRDNLFIQIQAQALDYGIAEACVEEIDTINILQATLLAMQRAVTKLTIVPSKILIDGNKAPDLAYPTETVIGGDAKYDCIMAASILAKVTRDKLMLAYHADYPAYNFAQHKGYGTKAHRAAIKQHGKSLIHRQSFNVR